MATGIQGGNKGTFWTQSPAKDPKRAFRFKVQFGQSGVLWYAKTAQRPTLSFTEATHSYLNHTYYWPGRAEWSEITITFVDPVEPDLGGDLVEALSNAGYRIPAGTSAASDMSSPSKLTSTQALGPSSDSNDVQIFMIDENGNELESWTLKHAWMKSIEFGQLDYSSDEMTEISVVFRYDWAQFESIRDGAVTKGPFFGVGS
jgi:hypothetical protein